ncbi:MAG TPA: acyl-CoA dehydrogenase family protein [Byssovorax sp.]|jgi:alkylation response protein AidB-like acyl-CoA dehydrogenase
MAEIDLEAVGRARAVAATVAPLAVEIERGRRLPEAALAALVDAGAFKLLVPRAYGGAEASIHTVVAVAEEIARGDGSAGWCAMIGATCGLMAAYLPEEAAREVFGPRDAVTAGVFAPMGRAVRVDGGLRASGRWAFASGCEHARFRMGGAIVDGEPPLASGAPHVRSLLFRAEDTRVIDTWSTSGLCGTGSHDFEVEDAFVPASRCFSLLADRPRFEGVAYRVPFFSALAACVASVGLGVGRGALDTLLALATSKRPQGSKRTLAQREVVQLAFARADARLRGARAGLHEAVAELEREVGGGGEASIAARAALRASASFAATEAAAVVDAAYEAAGATAVYASSPLQRQLRDAHVVTQHLMVSSTAAALAGRALLGLEADTAML